MDEIQMSGQKYKRTNFDDDDNTSTGGTPPGVTYDPAIAFKAGATFCQKRTTLERLLLAVLVISTLVIVVLSALLASRHAQPPPPKPVEQAKSELCTSAACVTVASSILTSMDTSVDPCDDFYQYACGGWIKAHPIPSGQSRWGTFGVMWKENQLVLKNALEKPLNASETESERKAKIYYQSCMDPNKTIEKLGGTPLIDLLTDMGGWSISPRSGIFDPSKFDLQSAIEHVHSFGLSILFNIWVGEDEKDTKTNIIQFDQSGLGLTRDEYLNRTIEDDKVLSAYLKFMVDIGVLLGGEKNDTYDQMYKVIEFEIQLANITTPDSERQDDEKTYHKMTVAQLQQIAPFMDWQHYLSTLFSVTSYKIFSNESVVVFAPEFLSRLSQFITETMKTDEGRNTINNYMKWHVAKLASSYLSKAFIEAKKEFTRAITGVQGDEEAWRYCVSDTDGVVGYALGAMFVKEAFHGNSKDKAEEMIQSIKTAFKTNLPNLAWMDAETRLAAIHKADAVLDMIGFPEYILNHTALDDRYKNLHIFPEEYFQNNINELHFGLQRNLNKLRKLPDKKSWSMTPPTVNAYYTPTKNEIVFPAGILQAPFYDQKYPKSLNFGGMGVVMGHELTHGFDDQGREYDATGILRPWWNNASIERFQEQTQCFVDQYENFKVQEEHVNGKKTLGENIADNGGLKAAYHAYESWVEKNGEEQPLPGIHLSHKQLFFLSFAQVWCTNSKPEFDKRSLLTDPHSPPMYRVIGPLSNSREFAENFKCKKDAKMNPEKKCEVW